MSERWAAAAGALLAGAADLDAAGARLRAYLATGAAGELTNLASVERLRSLLPHTEREIDLAVRLGIAWVRGRRSIPMRRGSWSPVVSGPELDARTFPRLTGETLIGMIGTASTEILMATAYLDGQGAQALLPSLSAAARRGVAIELAAVAQLVRDDALELLARALAGDRLMVHRLRAGNGFPHCKVLVVDGRSAYVGSANFTYQGMSGNYELGAMVDGEAVEAIRQLVRRLLDQEGEPLG